MRVSPTAQAASSSGSAPHLQQIETEQRTLAAAFQAERVYFCWKHNCLWLWKHVFARQTARRAACAHVAVTAPCGDPTDLLVTQEGDIWRGEMFFLWRGVNTAQMCSAVMRSDFIHEDTTGSVIAYRAGREGKFESKSPQILKDYRHGNLINLIIFMNICAARGRQPRSFGLCGKK